MFDNSELYVFTVSSIDVVGFNKFLIVPFPFLLFRFINFLPSSHSKCKDVNKE